MLLAAIAFSFLVYASPVQTAPTADAYRGILQSRLKSDSLSFIEGKELFEFADSITPRINGPARAEFELLRLRALKRSLDHIMEYEPKDPAMRGWIKLHEARLVFSEPAGSWLVDAKAYWDLEAKHRGNMIADQIAWDGVQAGVPGECEGYIPCSLAVLLMTDAKYLDLYPKGTHAAEAVDRIDYILQEILRPNSPYTIEAGDAMELRESVAKLTGIIERSAIPRKADVIARLKKVEQIRPR